MDTMIAILKRSFWKNSKKKFWHFLKGIFRLGAIWRAKNSSDEFLSMFRRSRFGSSIWCIFISVSPLVNAFARSRFAIFMEAILSRLDLDFSATGSTRSRPSCVGGSWRKSRFLFARVDLTPTRPLLHRPTSCFLQCSRRICNKLALRTPAPLETQSFSA